jgi:hypothetical protein
VKITTSLENINSFGGLNFISTEFDQLELPKLITSSLGSRSALATYQYHDIIKNIWMILFSGGDCAEDIQTNLKAELSNVLNMKICSADTLLRLQKELSLAKEVHLSKNNIENEFSNHPCLNHLNLSILLLTNQLAQDKSYDLDFDNQFIACEKYDAKKGYKMQRGYFPAIASIGKNIVYLENKNGNCNVKYKQEKTLSNVYKMLQSKAISIKRSRMDCGSFTKAVIEVVQKNSELFYI